MVRDGMVDGWRGVSICLVIIGHLTMSRFAAYFQARPFHLVLSATPIDTLEVIKNVVLRPLDAFPVLGVNIFFIISGYLITKLLIHEENQHHCVSIPAFYIRRICRILPAFLAFLGAAFALTQAGFLSIQSQEFLSAGAFLCNTPYGTCLWWLGHTWSLSIEEQFYLFWPLAFVFLRRSARPAGLLIALTALSVLSAFDILTVRWMNNAMFFSCIAMGALYASSAPAAYWVDRLSTRHLIGFATFVLLLRPFLASFPTATKIIELLTPILLAIIFFGTLNRRGFIASLVSLKAFRKIGLVSYSLYLWQQPFLARPDMYPVNSFMLIPAGFIPCALISYLVVEKPMIEIGHSLSARMSARKALASATSQQEPT